VTEAGTQRGAASPHGHTAGHDYAVLHREVRFTGPMFSIVTDDVAMPGGTHAERDFMRHVGAVGVVALDADGRVVLVRQYRHPVGGFLWELPAGLIDVAGEPLADAAARELAEEADVTAASWQLLADLHTTPGCSNEVIRLFLARDLTGVGDGERYHREHEEAELTTCRLPLDEAIDMVFRGEITNAAAVVGLLAAARLRDKGFPPVRPADAPLPPRRT
jgi:8-oxo-dGTP pyrophosphatase MutT (NUDIX family)